MQLVCAIQNVCCIFLSTVEDQDNERDCPQFKLPAAPTYMNSAIVTGSGEVERRPTSYQSYAAAETSKPNQQSSSSISALLVSPSEVNVALDQPLPVHPHGRTPVQNHSNVTGVVEQLGLPSSPSNWPCPSDAPCEQQPCLGVSTSAVPVLTPPCAAVTHHQPAGSHEQFSLQR